MARPKSEDKRNAIMEAATRVIAAQGLGAPTMKIAEEAGVANGSLTPHETANLEHKEAGLNHEIRRDRRQNGGNLTNKEKAQINRQQNRLSRNIYRDKHNAAHQ